MSTCGRQNNDPRRHSCPTSLNPGNVVKGILADATVGNTEREAGQKRGRQDGREAGRTEEREAGRKRGRQDGREGGRTEERETDRRPRNRALPSTAGCKDGRRAHEPGNVGPSRLERASLVAQRAESPPATQETQETRVRSLSGEDPLQKEMATCSSTLA